MKVPVTVERTEPKKVKMKPKKRNYKRKKYFVKKVILPVLEALFLIGCMVTIAVLALFF